MRRNWLRPKLYVSRVGNLVASTPWPDSGPVYGEDALFTCSRCGETVDEGTGTLEEMYCFACACDPEVTDRLRTQSQARAAARTPWKRLWDGVNIRLDNLYFAYAQRFGKRVRA